MTPTTLQKITDRLSTGEMSRTAFGHSIDSRTLKPGDVFWALPGRQFDGHQFVATAFKNGASAAVVSRDIPGQPGPLIQVDDVHTAMWSAAEEHRSAQEALMIGLTGSVGKTTTRQMLHAVLSSRYNGTASQQNFNNHLGVPLSLLSIRNDDEYAVIEMGASTQGEIARLSNLVQPEIGILTHISPAHLDGFGSLEGVIAGKSELFSAIPAEGLAVLPEHLYALPAIRKQIRCRVLTVGQSSTADVLATDVDCRDDSVQFRSGDDSFRLNMPGKQFVGSAAICVAVGRELGLTTEEIQAGFDRFEPVNGRCCRLNIGDWSVIDDTYNASPAAMSAGLQTLLQLPVSGPRIAVLGDMKCLGEQSQHYHRKLGQEVARCGVDYLLVYGEFADTVARSAARTGMSASRIAAFEDLQQLQDILPLWLSPGAGLLLKASRAMQLERLLPFLEAEAGEARTSLRRAG